MSLAAAPATHRRGMLLTWLACTAAFCIANITWWMQPVLIDQLVAVRGLTATLAGLIVSIEMIGMAGTAYLLAKFLKTGRFLTLGMLGSLIALLGSGISLSTHNIAIFSLMRLVTGIGEGFAFMVANTAIVCFADRDRAFAHMVTANVVFGMGVVWLPRFLPVSGDTLSGFVALVIGLCICAPVVLLMPSSARLGADAAEAAGHVASQKPSAHVGRMIKLLSALTFIIGLASGLMWSFYGIIGQGTGLSEASVNDVIATSILAAMAGSGAASVLGAKWGRIWPVTVGLVIMTGAIVCLSSHPTAWEFRVATCLNISTLYFVTPYLFAAGSVQDDSGLGATYVGSAFLMTGAVSPFLGGLLVDSVGMTVIGVSVVVTSIISLAMFVYVERHS